MAVARSVQLGFYIRTLKSLFFLDDGSPCHYNNKTYKTGDRFRDIDDCNTCHCDSGFVACTEMACIPG